MAIEINRAWLTKADGTDCEPTYQMIACNTSQLADNMKHKSYNAARILYWHADYDTNTTPSDLIDSVKTMCRSALSRENEMFDHSFCWAGLGSESFLSNVKYVCYGDIITGQGTSPQVYQNHDYNTPWSFDLYLNDGANKVYQYLTFDYSSMADSNTKANRIRCYCWKNTADENPNNPQAYWTSSSSGSGYFCTALRPIHKIALKNWINLIIVIAKSGRGANYSGVRGFDLYTYVNTNAHENYPYIIMVTLVPMMRTNTSGNNRMIIGSGDTPINPLLSLTTYTQPAMSGELAYTSAATGTPKVYYPESMWRQGMFIGGYLRGDGNAPVSGASTNFLCNDNNYHSVYMTANIPIMGAMIGAQGDGAGNLQYKNQLYTIFEIGNDKWYDHKWSYAGTDYLCYLRDYDSDFYDECLTQAACFGMFFTDRYTVAYNGELYNENMFLGTLDNNNIGHGEYTRGLKNASQKQWDWTDSSDADYNPEYSPDEPDENNYDNNSAFNSPSIPKGLFKYYVLNSAGVENFKNELWKAFDLKPQDIDYTEFAKDQFLTNEPLDLVVSLKKYPMVLSQASGPEAVTIGKYVTNVQANELVSSFTFIDLGTVTINAHFGGNFLDYDYTQLALYIPFCGVVSLDTSIYMSKKCRVYMSVDYTSGSCTAYIMCGTDLGWLVTNTLNGQMAVDLPLSGIQAKTLEQNLASAKSAVTKSGVVGAGKTLAGIGMTVAGAVTGGVPLVLGGLGSITSGINDVNKSVKQEYELHNTQIPIDQIGSLTALNAWTGELRPRLTIYRPITSMYVDTPNLATPIESRMQAYGHSEGFAVVEVGTINSLGISGYAEFTNIDLSGIVATEEVKRDIISQLVNGVYV